MAGLSPGEKGDFKPASLRSSWSTPFPYDTDISVLWSRSSLQRSSAVGSLQPAASASSDRRSGFLRTSQWSDGYLLPNSEQVTNTSTASAAQNRQEARCLARLSVRLETVFTPRFTNVLTRSQRPKSSHIDSTPYARCAGHLFNENSGMCGI